MRKISLESEVFCLKKKELFDAVAGLMVVIKSEFFIDPS
jgi:hypothetical protein